MYQLIAIISISFLVAIFGVCGQESDPTPPLKFPVLKAESANSTDNDTCQKLAGKNSKPINNKDTSCTLKCSGSSVKSVYRPYGTQCGKAQNGVCNGGTCMVTDPEVVAICKEQVGEDYNYGIKYGLCQVICASITSYNSYSNTYKVDSIKDGEQCFYGAYTGACQSGYCNIAS